MIWAVEITVDRELGCITSQIPVKLIAPSTFFVAGSLIGDAEHTQLWTG
ncbi:hypothetical protein ADA01nite_11240 [Aneurinibacillus danicus]|uniref:Uncharacterized protein n=1 Tax=Aneurinibacillus danicus TaxID=267746 RepID=A0A511V420_9BACL|nr:hypothetical protein ADA01nite_11240 [Aneurinibacillus danicus]